MAVRVRHGAPVMGSYRGWALRCLENRWTAEKAVGVRFYHLPANLCVDSKAIMRLIATQV